MTIYTKATSVMRYKAFVIFVVVLLSSTFLNAQSDVAIPKKITVGADIYYPPYEFLDGKAPSGFSVELIKAIGLEMGFEVEVVFDEWHSIFKNLKDNKLDAVVGMAYSPERAELFAFSRPHSQIESIIVVRKDNDTIKSEADLKGKRILVQQDDIFHEYILSKGYAGNITTTSTADSTLVLLSQGNCDAALINYYQFKYLSKQNKYDNLMATPGLILANEFCFAALKDNKEVIAILNEGLVRLKENGSYSYLYNKWFGDYNQTITPLSSYLRIFSIIFVGLLLIAFVVMFWIISLKAEVQKRTDLLNDELFKHKITIKEREKSKNVLQAMYNISEAINISQTLDELFKVIHKAIKSLVEADDFYIAIYDEAEDSVFFPYFNDRTHDSLPAKRYSGQGLTEYVIKRGKSMLLNQEQVFELRDKGLIEVIGGISQQWLGVPLVIDNKIIGVIAVQNYVKIDAYDENDKQILTYISEQVALAIQKKQNEDLIRRNISELEEKVVERTLELQKSEEAYRVLTENSVDLIMRFDKELRFIYTNPAIERYSDRRATDFLGLTITDLEVPESLSLKMEKIISSAFITGEMSNLEFQLPNGAWLDSNLIPEFSADGKVNSVIVTAHDITVRKNYQNEVNILNTQLELRVKERTEQLENEIAVNIQKTNVQRALFLISESVHNAKDIQELYENIHNAVKQFMIAKNFTVVLYDDKKQLISFPYNENEFDEHPMPRTLKKGITEYTLRQGKSIYVSEKELRELIKKGEIELIGRVSKSWLGIPMTIDKKIVGLLVLKDYENEKAFDEATIQILNFVSEQIALAIDRKESEDIEKRQKIFFEQLFENTPVGIIILDKDDKIVDANQGFTTLFGYSKEEILGRPINPLISPDDLVQEANSISTSTQKGEIIEAETYRKTKSGDLKRVKIFGVPVKIDGHQVGIYGIYLDISQLQNAQDSLLEEKEKFSVMLSSIGDGVIATSLDGKVILLNKAAQELTGWTQEEAEGENIQKVFNATDEMNIEASNNVIQKVISTDGILHFSGKTTMISREGKELQIEDSAAPIRDKDGNIKGVIIVFRDITQKKLIEEELQKGAKLESVGLLAGGIAHDFNNILTSIMGNISLAQSLAGNNNTKLLERLIEAENASIKAKELTLQLLTYAKGGEPVKKTVSLKQFMQDTMKSYPDGDNIDYKLEVADDVYNTDIDAGQLTQALNNIINNSQESMPNGGTIVIKAENYDLSDPLPFSINPGNYVKISIKDTGCGIDPNYLAKIFDPFFSTKKEGSGLGLATSYSIIKKHDGYIYAESELGKGSLFTILLPASTETISSDDMAVFSVGSGTSILIMDDDTSLVEVLTEMLENLGYDVVSTFEGISAFNTYKEMKEKGQGFDAVILDLTIPGGVGGKETVKNIINYDPEAVCVVSSGYSADPVMSEYEKHGFKAVLTKPYSFSQLDNTLRRVLKK